VCNVALNRPSYQSTVYVNDYPTFGPHKANDGMWTNALYPHLAHSLSEPYPWWAVDLGVPLSVKEIFFTNRKSAVDGGQLKLVMKFQIL